MKADIDLAPSETTQVFGALADDFFLQECLGGGGGVQKGGGVWRVLSKEKKI